MGAEPAGAVADLALAEAQCAGRAAPDYDLPEAYHINGKVPELKGGLVLKKCDAERARKIDLLFLSIGGNDVGFARLVANAVLSDTSMLRSLSGWFGQVHGFAEASSPLDVLDDRIKSVNRALHNILHVPWPESDRIVLIGYPPMAMLGDGKSVCPDGRGGMDVLPDFALSEAKAREGGALAERLNDVMRDSARQYSWTFVERASRRRSSAVASARASAMRPGAWPTRCACRARSTGNGSRSTPPTGAPTPPGSAGSARPTTPS